MTKILILTANPLDSKRLDVDAEVRDIQAALERTEFEVVPRLAARAEDFRALLERPAVVHFAGHGDTGGILLQTDDGYTHGVSPSALAGMFEVFRHNVRCVVLNACFTAAQAEALAVYIDWVVGHEGDIGDAEARRFATAFYVALGHGSDVELAFAYAEKSVALESDEKKIRPRLYQKTEARPFPAAARELSDINVPLQRPERAAHFTGRVPELARLLAELQPGATATLCGPGGIGKTALAAEAIWALAPGNAPPARFPDGIFFHSFYNSPSTDVALERIADAFGEEARPTPEMAAQRALNGRCALLVLDGAEDADDLRKVQRVAGDCGVLITSRRSEDAPGSEWQEMQPLAAEDATALIRAWVRDANADTARSICRLTGYLPLAVRLVGFYLAHRKMEPEVYLEWLRASPLKALDQGKRRDKSVPLLLERSLAQVIDDARQALAVVGLLAMAPFDSIVVAAAFAAPVFEAEDRLGDLINFGLLQRDGERYQVTHALIHTYARERLEVSAEVFERLTGWYTEFAETESAKGLEGYLRLHPERPHLLYLLESCMRREAWGAAHELGLAIDEYLNLQGFWTEWLCVCRTGLEAARKLENKENEGEWSRRQGIAYWDLGQMDKAIEYIEQALAIHREIGYRRGEGYALGNLGVIYKDLSQMKKAVEYHEQALNINREIGDRQGEGYVLGNLGIAYEKLDRTDKALEYYEQALAIRREIGYRQGEGLDLANLGNAYYSLGQTDKAVEYYEQALAIRREIGDRRGEGIDLYNLGNLYKNSGQIGKARAYLQQALTIFEEIKSPHAEKARRLLSEL